MRMLREAGHDIAVIHAPAVHALEVLTDLVTGQGDCWTKLLVPLRVVVDVVNAEEERIDGLPAMAERADVENGVIHDQVKRQRSKGKCTSPLTLAIRPDLRRHMAHRKLLLAALLSTYP